MISNNGGLDWHVNGNGKESFVGGDLVVDEKGGVLYVNDKRDHYKSLDGGKNWQEVVFGLHNGSENQQRCIDLHLNPMLGSEMICKTKSNALLKSQDSGNNWALLYSLPNEDKIAQIVYATKGMIYVVYQGEGAHQGINKSIDNGKSWELISNVTGKLLVHPENPNIIYRSVSADGLSTVYKSLDGGVHWDKLISFNYPYTQKALIMHPDNPEQLLFNDGRKELLLSDDGGKNWKVILKPFSDGSKDAASAHILKNMSALVFSPDNLNGLIATLSISVYESSDLGEHWVPVRGRFGEVVRSNKLKSTSNAVYSYSSDGIFKLTKKEDDKQSSECLFNWAEQQYPELFNPTPSFTASWNGYQYRYYSATNTYVGFLHKQEVHLLRPNISDDVSVIGHINTYLDLSGCQ
jgi:photosystem II stability/assembly factor-like uncharacterized protein